MGRAMLKIKVAMNYRRGTTWRRCGLCSHFVAAFEAHRSAVKPEPRCKVIGLRHGVGYRVGANGLCDAFDDVLSR